MLYIEILSNWSNIAGKSFFKSTILIQHKYNNILNRSIGAPPTKYSISIKIQTVDFLVFFRFERSGIDLLSRKRTILKTKTLRNMSWNNWCYFFGDSNDNMEKMKNNHVDKETYKYIHYIKWESPDHCTLQFKRVYGDRMCCSCCIGRYWNTKWNFVVVLFMARNVKKKKSYFSRENVSVLLLVQ